MNFEDWAVSLGKLNKDKVLTYWSGLKNTRFKEDNLAVTDIFSLHELVERIGKDTLEIEDVARLFTKPADTLDTDIKLFVQKYMEYLRGVDSGTEKKDDYQNFFYMLKFWITQTDNIINNKNNKNNEVKKPILREIKKGKIERALQEFTNPKFEESFLHYQGFDIQIKFNGSGKVKSEKVNYVVCVPEAAKSWNLNIRYNFDCKHLKLVYWLKTSYDSKDFKDYMVKGGWTTPKIFLISELKLEGNKPNHRVKTLFDEFKAMIEYAKNYEGGKNLKVTELAEKLKQNYNLILRGAPGTGKTYLAKEIAARIIGISKEELVLSDQFEFVQFHPSYDYTDFVEGLRPVQIKGQVGFEPKNGTFKSFCKNALLHHDNQFELFNNVWQNFINNVDEAGELLIPPVYSKMDLIYSVSNNRNLKEENASNVQTITKENVFRFWKRLKNRESRGHQSKLMDIVNYLKEQYNLPDYDEVQGKDTGVNDKKYVFVIDEINRGEISKIFGELFFSIDPEYRGVAGAVSTQYANLFEESEKFYVPENVYIIGTMNDIDRSVDTFDFAMRRRFSFEEITAADSQVMLRSDKVKNRMTALNDAIISSEISLSTDYQIGASYFRVLEDDTKNLGVDELWKNKLQPLLKDYFRGERNAEDKLKILESAYFIGDVDDSSEG